jgi:N6-L-threonylcarbamoyladenine synthase
VFGVFYTETGDFHPVIPLEVESFERNVEPDNLSEVTNVSLKESFLNSRELQEQERGKQQRYGNVCAVNHNIPYPSESPNFDTLPLHLLIRMQPVILAIESSCDETSAAILRNGKVLNNVIASQNVHQKYGGVVPELASRAHQKNILHVVNEAMSTAGISTRELDAIAFTRGPGLMGALLVGSSFAKGMAVALKIPLIEVNHMEAHVLAHFIPLEERNSRDGSGEPAQKHEPSFPFLCLTVSGGHTQIVLVKSHRDLEVIGETRDDAVGEAFDKAAKILGLPYPGGPIIDQYASKGDDKRFPFPETNMPGLDFSFSGIKTAFLYFIRDAKANDPEFVDKNLNDICASLQRHLVGMLMSRVKEAVQQTGIRQVAIAGGVSANSGLRKALTEAGQKNRWDVFMLPMQYCTDNAAMIAMAAHYKFLGGHFTKLDVSPVPNLEII